MSQVCDNTAKKSAGVTLNVTPWPWGQLSWHPFVRKQQLLCRAALEELAVRYCLQRYGPAHQEKLREESRQMYLDKSPLTAIDGAELLQRARGKAPAPEPPKLRVVPAERRPELLAFAEALERCDRRAVVTPATCEKHGVYQVGWGWYTDCPKCLSQPEPLMKLLTDPMCWPGHEFFWSNVRGHMGMWEHCIPGERWPCTKKAIQRLADLLPDMQLHEIVIDAAAREIERLRSRIAQLDAMLAADYAHHHASALRQLLRLAVLRMREAPDLWETKPEADGFFDAMEALTRAVRFQLPRAADLVQPVKRDAQELLEQPGFAVGDELPATGDPPTVAAAWNDLLELARKAPVWIPVSERLPEPDVEVLVLADGRRHVAKLEAGRDALDAASGGAVTGERRVHIAGLQAQVGPLLRQRCAWCGEMLLDYDLRNVAVQPGTTVEEVTGGFEPGALIEVVGVNPKQLGVIEHKDGDNIPVGFCGDDRPPLRLVKTEVPP